MATKSGQKLDRYFILVSGWRIIHSRVKARINPVAMAIDRTQSFLERNRFLVFRANFLFSCTLCWYT